MLPDVLVLVNRPVRKLSSGYDMRVYNLCRRMPARLHLFVVGRGGKDVSRGPDLDRESVFTTIEELEPGFWGPPSWRRHFRTNEAEFLRLAHPGPYQALLARLRRRLAEHNIRKVVVFGANLSGIARDLGQPGTAIDICDSQALRLSRDARVTREPFRERVKRWRWTRTEGQLTRWFDVVTTIGPPDTLQLQQLSQGFGVDRLHSIPNGVGDQMVRQGSHAAERRGVAFWGNLPFPPNREAMRHFFQRVYLPYLQKQGVEVCVIGRDPEPWLLELASRDAQVRVLGFVDDLAAELCRYPVMVNPMVNGSGMKNKVLEAFGLRMAVVSTSMGIDAFPDAVDGTHLLVADDPEAFATAVLALLDDPGRRHRITEAAAEFLERDYRWATIGDRWNRLIGLQ